MERYGVASIVCASVVVVLVYAYRQRTAGLQLREKLLKVHAARTRKIVGCIECGQQLFPITVCCT